EETVRFQTRSGLLSATRRAEIIELDFPSRPAELCKPTDALAAALGRPPCEVRKSRDYLAIYESQAEAESLRPNMDLLAALDCLGTIVTAPGKDCDFVSRFFAPRAGIPEDPVTGSSHCTLIPYWAAKLGKRELFAKQISNRSGELYCRDLGERVGIGGKAIVYKRGQIEVPDLH